MSNANQNELLAAIEKAKGYARRMREYIQNADSVFSDRERWDGLHGQAMQLLGWDVETDALTAAFSPPEPAPSSLVPGWKLVPIDPTPEMRKAGMDDLGWWVEPYTAPRESGVAVDSDMSQEDADSINAMQMVVVGDLYRAMLSAAPAHMEKVE